MTHDHFLKETFVDRANAHIKRALSYFPVWKDLLFLSFIIIVYLMITVFIRALPRYAEKTVEYTNKDLVKTVWSPPSVTVDHYQLEIRDTRFFPGSRDKGGITMVKQSTSPGPEYQLKCEHNHSYTLSVAAVSPSGVSSPFSRESNLLICDQQPPAIEIEPLPSPAKLRYSSVTIRGSFVEPNLQFITLNGTSAGIDSVKGTFTARAQLYPGRNRLTLLAVDRAENTTTRIIDLDYAPVTIVSLPTGARIYWNGNYAYLGIYSGNTPQSFNQAIPGKQVMRLTYPGFNDHYRVIDFSELTTDMYAITLTPFSGITFSQKQQLTSHYQTIAVGQYSRPFVVDYDLDGDKDLLVGSKEGTIALFTNTGTDEKPELTGSQLLKAGDEVISVGTNAAPFVVDYNNDGEQDLLVGTGEGYLLLFANLGSNAQPAYGAPLVLRDAQGTAINAGSYCAPFVVDWNGDNKKDLFLGSGEGTLSLYLNEGTDNKPLFSPAQPVKADGAPIGVGSLAAPFAADWNGDGKLDLLIGDGDGYVHLYLDVSTGSTPQFIAAGLVKVNDERVSVDGTAVPFLLDWDNDGRKDLLVGCQQGDIYLFTD
jgi:WD40 repeat protein